MPDDIMKDMIRPINTIKPNITPNTTGALLALGLLEAVYVLDRGAAGDVDTVAG
jgi:hypothetical protein